MASFSSFTLTNQNPSKAIVIAYNFDGGTQIEYEKSHTFSPGSGYNVVSEGNVLFDVFLESKGSLEVKPRDAYDPAKYNVTLSLAPES